MKIRSEFLKIFIFCIIIALMFCILLFKTIQLKNFPEIQYGTDNLQRFNIIMPKNNNNVYAVIYFHGGGFSGGNKLNYPLFLKDFSDNNIFATVGYRLIKKDQIGTESAVTMDDIIADVDAALFKIFDYSKERGINIKGVILAGHSAGGHIALQYGYKYFKENDNREIKITACVSLSGSTSFSDISWSAMSYWGDDLEKRLESFSWRISELTGQNILIDQYNWIENNNWNDYQEYINEITPITFVERNYEIPPTLLVHALDDKCVPYNNALKLSDALRNAFVQHKFITVTGRGNNHLLGGKSKSAIKPFKIPKQPWVNETIEWINDFLE